jgi:hypothetical protein
MLKADAGLAASIHDVITKVGTKGALEAAQQIAVAPRASSLPRALAGRMGRSIVDTASASLAAAMKLVRPFLSKAGEGAAKKIGEESAGAGLQLLGWMRNKLTGRAKEVLGDMENDPASADNQADLRKQLIKQLESLNELTPETYLRDTLDRIANGHPISQIDELMPGTRHRPRDLTVVTKRLPRT